MAFCLGGERTDTLKVGVDAGSLCSHVLDQLRGDPYTTGIEHDKRQPRTAQGFKHGRCSPLVLQNTPPCRHGDIKTARIVVEERLNGERLLKDLVWCQLSGVGMVPRVGSPGHGDGERCEIVPLVDLLNDILDLAKIEAGKLEIAPVTGDLADACRRFAFGLEAKRRRGSASIRCGCVSV